jgi:hypothetical protein
LIDNSYFKITSNQSNLDELKYQMVRIKTKKPHQSNKMILKGEVNLSPIA